MATDMLRPEVDWQTCRSCDPCLAREVCRTRAIIKIDPDEPAVIEISRCNTCGLCVLECPYDAIIMRDTSAVGANRNGCLPYR
jgi:MinD superfamily P-loop ATPase